MQCFFSSISFEHPATSIIYAKLNHKQISPIVPRLPPTLLSPLSPRGSLNQASPTNPPLSLSFYLSLHACPPIDEGDYFYVKA
jgi:hypothetical protein